MTYKNRTARFRLEWERACNRLHFVAYISALNLNGPGDNKSTIYSSKFKKP